jgi:hypothetical protein
MELDMEMKKGDMY